MLLAIDVGNTNISFGVFDEARLVQHVRSESNRLRTSDEYAVLVSQMLALRGISADQVHGAIIASVVPALTDTIAELVSVEKVVGFQINPDGEILSMVRDKFFTAVRGESNELDAEFSFLPTEMIRNRN